MIQALHCDEDLISRRRYELTDGEWSIIEPLLPNKPRGVPRQDPVPEPLADIGFQPLLKTGTPRADREQLYSETHFDDGDDADVIVGPGCLYRPRGDILVGHLGFSQLGDDVRIE